MTSRNWERAETPFHSTEVLAQALWVYTGGGPGIQSRLCAQGIKYLQQFRYPAFGKYGSERHLEKDDENRITVISQVFASSLEAVSWMEALSRYMIC